MSHSEVGYNCWGAVTALCELTEVSLCLTSVILWIVPQILHVGGIGKTLLQPALNLVKNVIDLTLCLSFIASGSGPLFA